MVKYPAGVTPPAPAAAGALAQMKRAKAQSPETAHLTRRFLEALLGVGRDLPPAEREYAFVLADPAACRRYRTPKTDQPRAWRFDFCWPAQRVAVEIDGGVLCPTGGRHNRAADALKLAAAAELGWLVLSFNTITLRHAAGCVEQVRAVLAARGALFHAE